MNNKKIMEETKKKKNNNNSGGNEDSKKKERHIVSWTPEEDDILRQQISLQGTENWAIIASKFKDKTTRQCRRRWYTYLNSDFKKGGWSPEEDMLLCEAQRMFGNRWTEIAKIVSGRTDNAVKNRFSTLCKKRAKYEALVQENNNGLMNSNNEILMFHKRASNDEAEVNAPPAKRTRRSHLPARTENCIVGDRSLLQSGNQQPRPPFLLLAENLHNMFARCHLSNDKEISADAQNSKIQGTFLKKDDPKVTALIQQAELLSSLALKINTENTEQSLENAWKVLQDFLSQSKENDTPGFRICEVDIQLEDFKDLIEDLLSTNDGSQPCWRQPDLDGESPANSENSTGSTLMPYIAIDKIEEDQAGIEALHDEIGSELQINNPDKEISVGKYKKDIISSVITEGVGETLLCNDQAHDEKVISASSSAEFGSPLQVTPLFRSLAAAIPSPKFSESERNFLLKTLGIDSPHPNQCLNPSQPPSCKRALLKSL